jgi:hypothetical protein
MARLCPLCLSLTLLTAGRALTAPQATPPTAPAPATISLAFDRIDIQRVAQTLTEQTHKSVLLDASVQPTTVVTSTGGAKTLEEALNQLTKPLGLVWKKVYVTKTAIPIDGRQVARLVDTVKGVLSPGVVVEDPATRQVTLYLRDLPAAPDLEAQIKTAWPFLQPVYLLSDPRPSAKKNEKQERPRPNSPEQFAQLEQQRTAMFLKMSPEDRAKAVQQAMSMMLQTDPAAMQQMMQAGMQAWVQTMQQMTPDQRQQFVAMSMQMMQTIPADTWQNLFQMFRPGAGAGAAPGKN